MPSRPLSASETTEARLVFGNSLDYIHAFVSENASWPDWVDKMGAGLQKRIRPPDEHNAITVGQTSFFPVTLDTSAELIGAGQLRDMAWLIHELTHQLQYRRMGWVYLGRALSVQLRLGRLAYDYQGAYPTTEAALSALGIRYSPAAIATVSGNVTAARGLLTAAGQGAESALARLADPLATDVADRVQEARVTATRAVRLLDAVDSFSASLAEQSDRLASLTTQSQGDLAEARSARDAAPDPESGAAIGAAVSALESVLGSLVSGEPAASLRLLENAVTELDSALATARNQTQRLEHASAALVGVLVRARSQIAATQDFIASRRGGVGADARTRLAEAQRLLEVAEAQSDPVAALDSARSSATYSRDADALARFDDHR